MKTYIEKEALLAFPIRINHYDKENGNLDFVLGIESVMEYAENIPTADVMPMKHGQWEKVIPTKSAVKWSNKVSCSICHFAGHTRYNYCPNCGAKMDLED